MPGLRDFQALIDRYPDASDEELLALARGGGDASAPALPSVLKDAWDWGNRPLVDLADDAFGDSAAGRFGVGLAESLTSPLSVAGLALSGGASAAGKLGLLGLSRAARGTEAALNVPYIAEGLSTLAGAAGPGEAAGGAIEAALGSWGLAGALRRPTVRPTQVIPVRPPESPTEALTRQANAALGLPARMGVTPPALNGPSLADEIRDSRIWNEQRGSFPLGNVGEPDLPYEEMVAETLDGGGASRFLDGRSPSQGAMVGGVVPPQTLDQLTPEALAQFALRHRSALEAAPNRTLGAFRDKGAFDLDVSENVGGLEEALRLARDRGEKSVFDLGTFETYPNPAHPDTATHWQELVHRSPTKGLTMVDPAFQGSGIPGQERARRAAFPDEFIPRSYWNTPESAVEDVVAKATKDGDTYTGFIKKDALFDEQAREAEAQAILARLQEETSDPALLRTRFERALRDAGFGGSMATESKVRWNDQAMKYLPDGVRQDVMTFQRQPVVQRDWLEQLRQEGAPTPTERAAALADGTTGGGLASPAMVAPLALGGGAAAAENGEEGLSPIQMALLAGAGVSGAALARRVPNPIRAYHGGPSRFARFDLGKLGTGEGGQMFSRGLYFAGEPRVGRGYQDRLAAGELYSGTTSDPRRYTEAALDGRLAEVVAEDLPPAFQQPVLEAAQHEALQARRYGRAAGGDLAGAIKRAIKGVIRGGVPADSPEGQRALDLLVELDRRPVNAGPRYEGFDFRTHPDLGIRKALSSFSREGVHDLRQALAQTLDEQRGLLQKAANDPQLGPYQREVVAALEGMDPEKLDWVRPGYFYEVDLHTYPQRLLDWDRSWLDQPGLVRSFIDKIPGLRGKLAGRPEFTGQDLLIAAGDQSFIPEMQSSEGLRTAALFHKDPKAPERASALLRSAGLDGVQYLDQWSRAQGRGTQNFVMHRDDVIDVVSRNGQSLKAASQAGADEVARASAKMAPALLAAPAAMDEDGELSPIQQALAAAGLGVAGMGLLRKRTSPALNAPYERVGDRLLISTRVPTGVAARSINPDPSAALFTGLDVAQTDPALMAKLARGIDADPLLRGQTPDAVRAFTEAASRSIGRLIDMVPEDYRRRSAGWYEGAHRLGNDLAARIGVSGEQGAGLLAIQSPSKDWNQNIEIANRLGRWWREFKDTDAVFTQDHFDQYADGARKSAAAWVKDTGLTGQEAADYLAKAEQKLADVRGFVGTRFEDLPDMQRAQMIRAHSELVEPPGYSLYTPEGDAFRPATTGAGEPGRLQWQSYPFMAAGLSILEDGSPANISAAMGMGHKVRSFFNNINVPADPRSVTVDTHNVAGAHFRPLGGSAPEVMAVMGGTPASAALGVRGKHAIYRDAVAMAAAQRGLRPSQAQSISWEGIKGLFTPAQKRDTRFKTALSSIFADYQRGMLSEGQLYDRIEALAGGFKPADWAQYPPAAH